MRRRSFGGISRRSAPRTSVLQEATSIATIRPPRSSLRVARSQRSVRLPARVQSSLPSAESATAETGASCPWRPLPQTCQRAASVARGAAPLGRRRASSHRRT